jgi:hypothetical protein
MEHDVTAACDKCGRGYLALNAYAPPCLVGGCVGRIWPLPVAEANVTETPEVQGRRAALAVQSRRDIRLRKQLESRSGRVRHDAAALRGGE